MRNLPFCNEKWDKKFILAFIITLICAIMCGIVLYKPVTTNIYFVNFGSDYVFNVFNFNTTPIFFTHLLSDVIYFYLFFLISYCTKFKYVTLVFLYLKGLFFGVYTVILICAATVSGVLVAVFVFIPATLLAVFICLTLTEMSRRIDKRAAYALPLILAVADGIVLMLLINVVFRIVIIIV